MDAIMLQAAGPDGCLIADDNGAGAQAEARDVIQLIADRGTRVTDLNRDPVRWIEKVVPLR